MKIGIAGPIDLRLLTGLFPAAVELPCTYRFPLTAHLARALHNRGHEVVLFALSREVVNTRRIDGERICVYICPQRQPWSQMLDFFRKERHGLRDAMRGSNCNVIHAHWTYEFASAAIQSGVPCVVTAHDVPTAVLRFARHPYWLEKPLLAWSVLREARCITAVSPYVARALRPFIKRGREIIVIPNGAIAGVFALYGNREPRPECTPFRFASVLNGWSVRKNSFRVIQAFGLLRREFGGQVELSMFGDGHERDGPAHRWAMQRRLDDGVMFLGALGYESLMSEIANRVDVFVHPALEEAHSMAVTEAMALGLPVIGGAKSGGIPWALAYGKAGLLVDVTSSASIASGMRTLLKDDSFRGALARSGRQRALDEYRLEAVAEKYETLLLKVSEERAL